MPALAVAGLSHAYGDRVALDDVSLSVARGSFCALLGLNGAGKSTLFALITRLFNSRSGTIEVLGFDVRRRPGEALRRIGVVFQSRTLDAELSIAQNLAYHAALHGLPARATAARAEALLDGVGLAARAGEKVRALSGGQLRRVEIVRALLHRPGLLLLDEPTVGLDVGARASIRAEVRRLLEAEQLGVLWATHLFDEVEPGDDVVMLHRGRVMSAGGVADITARTGAASLEAAFRTVTGLPSEAAMRAEVGHDGIAG